MYYLYFLGNHICSSIKQADHFYLLFIIGGTAHERKELVVVENDYRESELNWI